MRKWLAIVGIIAFVAGWFTLLVVLPSILDEWFDDLIMCSNQFAMDTNEACDETVSLGFDAELIVALSITALGVFVGPLLPIPFLQNRKTATWAKVAVSGIILYEFVMLMLIILSLF